MINTTAANNNDNGAVVCVNNLQVCVGKKLLLSGINFEVRAGELLSVVGANGAGKTSLLKALVGDIAYNGRIKFLGLGDEPVLLPSAGLPLGKRLARQIAFLPQLSLLNFPFLAAEVIALGRYPHSSGVTADHEIVEAVARKMDVVHLLHRSYTQLSGGEKQRVQLARVMAQLWPESEHKVQTPYRLLLLDEPMSALDPGHQQLVLTSLCDFANTGVAVVLVMHDINLAARYSESMLALDRGRQVALGSPQEVVTAEVIRRLFAIDVEIMRHPLTQSPVMLTL